MTFKSYILLIIHMLMIVIVVSLRPNKNETDKVEKIISLSSSSASSSYSYASIMNDPVFKVWADYHKSSGKLDSTLTKCYECVSERSEESKLDKSMNAYTSPALNTFYYPKFTDTQAGSVAWWLNGPVIKSGGQFVSARSSNYSSSIGNGYNVNAYNPRYNKPTAMTSLSCVVGKHGVDAYPVACEYGENYCQTTILYGEGILEVGKCVAICDPLLVFGFIVCTAGTLSNKLTPLCPVGDLSPGSGGAYPVACPQDYQCQIDENYLVKCVANCLSPGFPTSIQCSTADYPFQGIRGPMCYVGTFENGAALKACGNSEVCMTVKTMPGSTIGSCVTSCTELATCTTTDFANKQGILCYVGTFGNNAKPMSCAVNQFCQRSNVITLLGSSLSTGSCATTCVSSSTNLCCKTDFCNAYESTLNYGRCDAPSSYASPSPSYVRN